LRLLALEESEDADQAGYLETWSALKSTVHIDDTTQFEARLAGCPEAHRRKWLEMYANPVVNKYRSKSSSLSPV
jgi:ABC-type uncharacterized transport system ATPase subunit